MLEVSVYGGGKVNKIIHQDKTFCQFDTLQNGYRAAALLLKKYINVYKLDTIEKIVGRWAPTNENNTKGYIEYVSFITGIYPDTSISFNEIKEVMRAMVMKENGVFYDPYKQKATLKALTDGYMNAYHDVRYNVQGEKK